MFHRLIERVLPRVLSMAIAVTVTLGMLGGIDRLAQPDEASAQWAQASSPRA